jgi:hypothetical protein
MGPACLHFIRAWPKPVEGRRGSASAHYEHDPTDFGDTHLYHLNVSGRERPRDGGLSRFPPVIEKIHSFYSHVTVICASLACVSAHCLISCSEEAMSSSTVN